MRIHENIFYELSKFWKLKSVSLSIHRTDWSDAIDKSNTIDLSSILKSHTFLIFISEETEATPRRRPL